MAERQMHSTRTPLEPLNKLKNWPITEALASWLDRIGFGFLSKLNQHKPQIKIDRKLVNYIVSFYNKDSYCFEFNGIQLFFSLIDVYMLTGLPVSGKPVLGHTDDPTILFNKAFPSFPIKDCKTESAIFSKAKIKTTWLHNRFSSLQVNEGDPLWDEYRRAFMLWCISSYIVPDASTGVVEIEYTTILTNLEDIGNYAWGAAAWATMQHQLKSRKLNGMAYALVLFMVLRVEPLYKLLLSPSGEQPNVEYQFPLILAYLTPLTKGCNHRFCLKNTSYDFLDTVCPDQINQKPYKRFPLRCKDQLAMACSKTLCFNRVVVEPHEPNRIPGQFGFVHIVVDHEFDLPDIEDQLPKKGPKKCRDLSIEYERYAKFWNDRTPLRGQLLDDWTVQPWMEEYQAGGEDGEACVEEPNGGGAHAEEPTGGGGGEGDSYENGNNDNEKSGRWGKGYERRCHHKFERDRGGARVEEMVEGEAIYEREKDVLNEIMGQKRDIVIKDISNSRRKLLVLDINGVLADIVQPVPFHGFNVPYMRVGNKAVFKRPHCDDFLLFCLKRFDVGIWSSKTPENVKSIIECLLGWTIRSRLLFIYNQSFCLPFKSGDKYVHCKEIEKLYALGDYDESNILLVDDSPHKALKNPTNTTIFPNTYKYYNKEDDSLGPKGDLRVYLEGLALAENVQEYVKNHPFGQHFITDDVEKWKRSSGRQNLKRKM